MTSFTYFEPLLDGHSTSWAQAILEAAAKDPRLSHIELVTNQQLAERLRTTCDRHGIVPEILPVQPQAALTKGNLWTRGRAQWRAALAIQARTQGDVFLPFFDHAVIAAAADRRNHRGRGQISGIIFRAPNCFGLRPSLGSKLDHLRRWASYRLAKRNKVKSLFTLDETVQQPEWAGKEDILSYLADPAPDLKDLCCHPQAPREDQRANWLLFGSLDRRKGIFQMVEAWAMMEPGFHRKNALRLVGRLSPADSVLFRQKLQTLCQSTPWMVIELVDQFVSDSELAREVCAAKVVLAPYQNHIGSSGALYWAAAAAKPILSQSSGLMGYLVQKYGLGLAIETENPALIAQALEREIPSRIDPRFYQLHDKFTFSQAILDGVISA